jgi:hypothetical protein
VFPLENSQNAAKVIYKKVNLLPGDPDSSLLCCYLIGKGYGVWHGRGLLKTGNTLQSPFLAFL